MPEHPSRHQVMVAPQEPLVAGGAAEAYERRVHDLFASGCRHLIADLRSADGIDSAGVRALVRSHTTAQRVGGTFTIIGPSPQVLEVLRLSRLDDVFRIKNTLEEGRVCSIPRAIAFIQRRAMRSVWIAGLCVAIATAAAAQGTQDQATDKPPVRFVFNEYPSIRMGPLRVDAHTKWQADSRRADQDLEKAGKTYETNLKRVGVAGRFTNRIQFEIERELRKENPWRNVFINVELAQALEVRGGKFKMPFSYEELTGATHLDFVNRTQLARIISPAREVGVMAHGRLLRRIVEYQAGWFKHDGENARLREPLFLLPNEEPPAADRSVAGRVTVEPFRHAPGPRELRRLYLGVAATTTKVPEGLNSFRGKSLFGTTFVDPVYVLGHRRRIGTEAVWMPGPVSVKSEWARSYEQRRRQGLLDEDLSDFMTTGWYVSGTWLVTGEKKDGGVDARKPLFEKGFGAIELGARYESISFASVLKQGIPFDNPRADPFLGNSEHVWTFGVNWYLNKWGKVAVNGLRESFDDANRTAIPGQKSGWAAILRLQFVM